LAAADTKHTALTYWHRLLSRIGVLENHLYFLKLKCTNCHDEFPTAVGISRDMEVEGIKGRAYSAALSLLECSKTASFGLTQHHSRAQSQVPLST
jgi:hypothetical protein